MLGLVERKELRSGLTGSSGAAAASSTAALADRKSENFMLNLKYKV